MVLWVFFSHFSDVGNIFVICYNANCLKLSIYTKSMSLSQIQTGWLFHITWFMLYKLMPFESLCKFLGLLKIFV